MRRLIKRALVIGLATVVILAGLLTGGVRVLDHLAPGYRQALAGRIGDRIGAKVRIDAIELHWRWNGPVLALRHFAITRNGADQPAVTTDAVGLEFSFAELIRGRRTPDGLRVDAPKVAFRLGADGHPDLVHWSRPSDPPLGWPAAERARALLDHVRIDDARIRLQSPHLPDGAETLGGVDIGLDAVGERLRWRVVAAGSALGHIASHGTLHGALPDVRSGRFEIDAEGIDPLALARANARLIDGPGGRLEGGQTSVHVHGRVRAHRLVTGRVRFELAALNQRTREAPVLPALAATFEVAESTHAPATLAFALGRRRGALPGLAQLAVYGDVDTASGGLRLAARHPPVAAARRVAEALYPRLAGFDVGADLDHLQLAAGPGRALQFGVDFDNATVASDRIEAGPIAGRYCRRGAQQTITFDNGGGRVKIARWLRGALPIDDLGGTLSWQREAGGWTIAAEQLHVQSGKAEVTAGGSVRLQPDAAPRVAIQASASAPDVRPLLAHIPQTADLPSRRLRDWLAKAIGAGALSSAKLALDGPLERFPFANARDGERFSLELAGRGVAVDYKPGWPKLTNARGRLVLDGVDLRVQVAAARMLGVNVASAAVHVPDVREPVLAVDAATRGAPAGRMLDFLVESPLRERFAKLVDALAISGPADLDLDLKVPLKPELGKPQVAGTATARGATLRENALPAPITDITGRIHFDDNGLTAHNLHGRLGGMALTTDITPTAGKRQRIVTTTALALPRDRDIAAHYLPRPWLRYARGRTDLRVAFAIARDGRLSDINVHSSMQGVALDLPAPLTKAAADAAPLAITIADRGQRVRAGYDDRLQIAARLADGHPTRVQAMVNKSTDAAPDVDGIWVGGHVPRLDGLGWFHVIRSQLKAASGSGEARPPLAFRGGNLRIGRLEIGNRSVADVQVRAQTMDSTPGWRIDFDGPNSQGQVRWTRSDGRAAISGNLARLALTTRPPAADQRDAPPSPVLWADVSPRALPGLDIYVGDVRVDDTDFGKLTVSATALPQGWRLEHLQLAGGDLTGSVGGRWLRGHGKTRARARADLSGRGLGGLLRALGYASTLEADAADLQANLEIAANPNGLDLHALDGSVTLALDDGTLVSVEPGAGRALGLFNFYVLPRRLALNFRDVVDKGLAFDSLRAHFKIENGNAYTDALTIETPSSSIRMSGRIGLAARDYDERVQIAPKLGSGVAIASGVLGGPLVGAAVLAFGKLFEKPIQHFSSIAYTLKGSWDNPSFDNPQAKQ